MDTGQQSRGHKTTNHLLQKTSQLRVRIPQIPDRNRPRHKNKQQNVHCGKLFCSSWICSNNVVQYPYGVIKSTTKVWQLNAKRYRIMPAAQGRD